jgi:hypothetical protein
MKVILFGDQFVIPGRTRPCAGEPGIQNRSTLCLDSGSTPTGPRKARPDDRLRACPGMTELTDLLAIIKE